MCKVFSFSAERRKRATRLGGAYERRIARPRPRPREDAAGFVGIGEVSLDLLKRVMEE